MPDTVDLLRVAADAGLPVLLAVEAVAPRAPPPWGAALGAAAERAQRGLLLAEALGELPAACGDPGHRLAIVLRGAGDGTDLGLGLDRLALDARDLRRRRTEEAARRVPVRLLAPLVLCALPAFVLLALAPLVAGAFQALHP
jgi:Flp pilus assembly protein TadB